MFWSLVRPDKILLPITRSAAVTTSLEADESAVGMVTIGSRSLPGVRPSDQRRASALRTAGRFIGLLWAGGGSKKRRCPSAGRGGGLILQNLYFSLQNQYNPPWQKEAVNRGQNLLFNRSNRLLSDRLWRLSGQQARRNRRLISAKQNSTSGGTYFRTTSSQPRPRSPF